MHVVLSTYGSRGDVEPMVALAVQLRSRGAEVSVCAPPDQEFVDLLEGVDLPIAAFPRAWRSWERPATPEERQRRVADFIDAQYDCVLAATRGADVLVATAMSHFVGQTIAEQAGLAYRYAVFSPSVLSDPDAQNWESLFGPSINAHRRRLGLPAIDDIAAFMFTGKPLLAADPLLAPAAASHVVTQTGAWTLPDRRALQPELEEFLAAGTPPIYVGFGSMRTVSEQTAHDAIAAVRAHGHRAVLARGWAELTLADADCFVVGEVNQQALFKRVSAAVHHGGAGTTTTAALAGVPQVVVPQAGDQTYWASRVAELGIGVGHDGPSPTPDSLSLALDEVLQTAVQKRAGVVAEQIRTDGAAEAARSLLADSTAHRLHLFDPA